MKWLQIILNFTNQKTHKNQAQTFEKKKQKKTERREK